MAKSNLSGKKFSRLLVIEEVGKDKAGRVAWKCICDCGNITVVRGGFLERGNTKSCGCLNSEIASKTNLKDLTDQKFGRLLVIKRFGKVGDGRVKWVCGCSCGNTSIVTGNDLLRGDTKSCGCLQKNRVSGENSYRWIKDRSKLTSPLKKQMIKLFEFIQWRKIVFARDNYTCQRCGRHSVKLCGHHVVPVAKIIKYFNITTIEEAKTCLLLFDVNNGITLCEDCHIWVHSNRNIGKEFLEDIIKGSKINEKIFT